MHLVENILNPIISNTETKSVIVGFIELLLFDYLFMVTHLSFNITWYVKFSLITVAFLFLVSALDESTHDACFQHIIYYCCCKIVHINNDIVK